MSAPDQSIEGTVAARQDAALSCPVCGSAELATLIRQPAARHLGLPVVFDIHRCTTCGAAFVANVPDTEALAAMYGQHFFSTSQQTVEVDGNGDFTPRSRRSPVYLNSRRRLERILSLCPGGRLLDVGCARGFFLKAASQAFVVTGTDLSDSAAAYARDTLGLEVVGGDFLTAPLPELHFDVITMWDVLAGLAEPVPGVEKVHRLLKPGGLFVFTVPDIGSLSFRLTRRFWPLLIPPVNLVYFTHRSVHALLEPRGFRILKYRHEGKSLSTNFVLRKLGRILNIRTLDRDSVRIPGIRNVFLNLRDIATVYARKV
jgi:SAM-dependent methyltransferase